MPIFIATTTSTFRHAYLIEAPSQTAALDILAANHDTLDNHEWYQEHLGETLTSVTETTLAEVTEQHEQTLRDKTNWWLPVETFILHQTTPTVVSEANPSGMANLDPRVTNMEATLVRDSVFMSRVSDRSFALRLYSTLCNTSWRHEDCPDSTVEWSCSWRYAGGLVADLRNAVCGTHEDYMDYYCQGNEGRIDPEVATRLATLGWHGEEARVPD